MRPSYPKRKSSPSQVAAIKQRQSPMGQLRLAAEQMASQPPKKKSPPRPPSKRSKGKRPPPGKEC